MARSFVDTNIPIYADDAFDPRKQAIALDLIVALRSKQAGATIAGVRIVNPFA